MTHSKLSKDEGFERIILALETAHEKDDYVKFIRFCVERLNKGETVQAIWHDFLCSKN